MCLGHIGKMKLKMKFYVLPVNIVELKQCYPQEVNFCGEKVTLTSSVFKLFKIYI